MIQGLSTVKHELPDSPNGCFWYFIGFCVFAALVVGVVEWLS
ncbi:hypothetical protein [Pirellulimonas nuda]|nr:hypothetical protein [Pirellulimonas nuda]